MAEIRAALAVGKTVITHTDPVSVPGWSGAGYIILDPDTGEGAYRIGGGLDGAFLLFWGTVTILAVLLILAVRAGNILGAAGLPLE